MPVGKRIPADILRDGLQNGIAAALLVEKIEIRQLERVLHVCSPVPRLCLRGEE